MMRKRASSLVLIRKRKVPLQKLMLALMFVAASGSSFAGQNRRPPSNQSVSVFDKSAAIFVRSVP